LHKTATTKNGDGAKLARENGRRMRKKSGDHAANVYEIRKAGARDWQASGIVLRQALFGYSRETASQ